MVLTVLPLPDLSGRLVAVHPRHLDVHQNEVEALFLEPFKCLIAIFDNGQPIGRKDGNAVVTVGYHPIVSRAVHRYDR